MSRIKTSWFFFLISGVIFWGAVVVGFTRVTFAASFALGFGVAVWSSGVVESISAGALSGVGFFIALEATSLVVQKGLTIPGLRMGCVMVEILYAPWVVAVPLGRLAARLRWIRSLKDVQSAGEPSSKGAQ